MVVSTGIPAGVDIHGDLFPSIPIHGHSLDRGSMIMLLSADHHPEWKSLI